MDRIEVRGEHDCGICVAAMLTGKSWEEASAGVDPDRWLTVPEMVLRLAALTGDGWEVDRVSDVTKVSAVLVTVDGFNRWVVWDGERFIDPRGEGSKGKIVAAVFRTATSRR